MSDMITVPYGGEHGDRATLLLAAASNLGYEPEVVATSGDGFRVPEDVAKKAGLHKEAAESTGTPVRNAGAEDTAKKSTAKKSTAKKAPAKKATKKAAKKSTAKKK